jgi:hypothetical protein
MKKASTTRFDTKAVERVSSYSTPRARYAYPTSTPHYECALTCAGIRTSLTIFQRQHSRLCRSSPAKVEPHCQRCASSLILVRSKRERVIAAPRMDTRVKPRRRIRYVRQGRPVRLVVATKAVIPRASTSHTVYTCRNSRLCIRTACQRNILCPHTAPKHRMVVWKRRYQHPGWGQFPCALLPR